MSGNVTILNEKESKHDGDGSSLLKSPDVGCLMGEKNGANLKQVSHMLNCRLLTKIVQNLHSFT